MSAYPLQQRRSTAAVSLGAPDIYTVPDEFRRTLGSERMDVCAFVGVAPRGPARVPVEPENCDETKPYVEQFRPRKSRAVVVESWDQYVNAFGAYEGPGRLPYAVANFFEQGGSRAYVVRVVHRYDNAQDFAAVAGMTLSNVSSVSGTARLEAKSEGAWGNSLHCVLGFIVRPVEFQAALSTPSQLVMQDRQQIHIGTLLRLRHDDFDELRFVTRITQNGSINSPRSDWELSIEGPALPNTPTKIDIVNGDCLILDVGTGRRERFVDVGLSATHPRAIANVLYRESALVNPHESFIDADLKPLNPDELPLDPATAVVDESSRFTDGEDRYEDIVPEDFFDPRWVAGDPDAGSGVHALMHLPDLSMLVTPDLYVPESLDLQPPPDIPEPLSGAEFGPCVRPVQTTTTFAPQVAELSGLMLDPRIPAELDRIVGLQKRLVDLAEWKHEFVVMLDVPPGLHHRQQLEWRSVFSSAYAAAYLPWLNISTLDDRRDALVLLNPAAVAAGVVARQEHQYGVFHGPANVVAQAVVSVDQLISRTQHDQIHPLGLNLFRQERDGVWITAARTLSRDSRLRQLSVLRLMVMLRRALRRQMQWVVFESNTPSLWSDLRFKIEAYLRQLYIAGAFVGASEEQAFFVRCDSELNDRRTIDAGRLIVEIGVAPAEPLEFIVVRITRDADGTLSVES